MQILDRRVLFQRLVALTSWALAPTPVVHAFSTPLAKHGAAKVSSGAAGDLTNSQQATAQVAFKGFELPIEEFQVRVPVACWFPTDQQSPEVQAQSQPATYDYRISVRRIGQLLADWQFIPGLVARDFSLSPTSAFVSDGSSSELPKSGPVIILAHGFLGSRFDLSHLAEALAAEGFTCISPEYPESLAASFDRMEGLDRDAINDKLLNYIQTNLGIQSTSFGIVGHSLGCFTVISTGDEKWARVCIAGSPLKRDGTAIPGDILFISSMGDGLAAKFGGAQAYPKDIVLLDEKEVLTSEGRIPPRSAILYDRPDAPNHISFLTESVNESMIDFLSALLPVAKAFNIPLLDFDRYQVSRDSKQVSGGCMRASAIVRKALTALVLT